MSTRTPRKRFGWTQIYAICRVNSEAIDLEHADSTIRDRVYAALFRRSTQMGRVLISPHRRGEICCEIGISVAAFGIALRELIALGDIRHLGIRTSVGDFVAGPQWGGAA